MTNFKMTSELFLEALQTKSENIFYVVDGSHPISPAKSGCLLRLYRNGSILIDDMLNKRLLLRDKCSIRWLEDPQKPVGGPQSFVPFEVVCSGETCKSNVTCSWFCVTCLAQIQLGIDNFLHCDCGISEIGNAEYKCLCTLHGLNYKTHSEEYILAMSARLLPVSIFFN